MFYPPPPAKVRPDNRQRAGTAEGAGTAKGSGQGQSAGGGTAERAGALGNWAVGSLTGTATKTGAHQTQAMTVTATLFQGRRSWNGFDRPVPGVRTTKEDDGTYRTDGRSRAGTTGGGNYGVGSNRANDGGDGGSTGRGGDFSRIGTTDGIGADIGNNGGIHRYSDSDVESG
jgi:hypothetical protein